MSRTTVAVKRAIGVTIGAAALLGMAACGGDQSSPDDLGNALASAANDQDIEAIRNLTCEKDKKAAEDFDFEKLKKQYDAQDMTFNVEFLKAEEKDDSAALTFRLQVDNIPEKLKQLGVPETSEQTQNAVKEDGDWVICS